MADSRSRDRGRTSYTSMPPSDVPGYRRPAPQFPLQTHSRAQSRSHSQFQLSSPAPPRRPATALGGSTSISASEAHKSNEHWDNQAPTPTEPATQSLAKQLALDIADLGKALRPPLSWDEQTAISHLAEQRERLANTMLMLVAVSAQPTIPHFEKRLVEFDSDRDALRVSTKGLANDGSDPAQTRMAIQKSVAPESVEQAVAAYFEANLEATIAGKSGEVWERAYAAGVSDMDFRASQPRWAGQASDGSFVLSSEPTDPVSVGLFKSYQKKTSTNMRHLYDRVRVLEKANEPGQVRAGEGQEGQDALVDQTVRRSSVEDVTAIEKRILDTFDAVFRSRLDPFDSNLAALTAARTSVEHAVEMLQLRVKSLDKEVSRISTFEERITDRVNKEDARLNELAKQTAARLLTQISAAEAALTKPMSDAQTQEIVERGLAGSNAEQVIQELQRTYKDEMLPTIQELGQATEHMRAELARLEQKLTELNLHVELVLPNLEDRIDVLEKRRDMDEAWMGDYNARLKALDEQLAGIGQEKSAATALSSQHQTRLDDLDTKLLKLGDQYNESESQLDRRIEALQITCSGSHSLVDEQIGSLTRQINETESEVSHLKQFSESCSKDTADANSRLELLQSSLAQLREHHDDLSQDVQSLIPLLTEQLGILKSLS